jgi:hypothetical protein
MLSHHRLHHYIFYFILLYWIVISHMSLCSSRKNARELHIIILRCEKRERTYTTHPRIAERQAHTFTSTHANSQKTPPNSLNVTVFIMSRSYPWSLMSIVVSLYWRPLDWSLLFVSTLHAPFASTIYVESGQNYLLFTCTYMSSSRVERMKKEVWPAYLFASHAFGSGQSCRILIVLFLSCILFKKE